jgi:hypothetical protein
MGLTAVAAAPFSARTRSFLYLSQPVPAHRLLLPAVIVVFFENGFIVQWKQ